MQHDDVGLLPPRSTVAAPEILIIEDNETNALILRCMLRKKGFEAAVASDGIDGVAAARRLLPRLILMDLHMPRLDGFAAAAEVRRLGLPHAPAIVAVTASAGPEVQAACLVAGFNAVLSKPVLLEPLFETVSRFLASS